MDQSKLNVVWTTRRVHGASRWYNHPKRKRPSQSLTQYFGRETSQAYSFPANQPAISRHLCKCAFTQFPCIIESCIRGTLVVVRIRASVIHMQCIQPGRPRSVCAGSQPSHVAALNCQDAAKPRPSRPCGLGQIRSFDWLVQGAQIASPHAFRGRAR